MKVTIQKHGTDHNGDLKPVSGNFRPRNQFYVVCVAGRYFGDVDKRSEALALASLAARKHGLEIINERI